jgi:hypothetical protein
VGQTPLPPLGHIDLLLIEAQVKPEISFTSLSRTFLEERTGLTDLRLKVSHKAFFLAALLNRHALLPGAGDLGRLPALCLHRPALRSVLFRRKQANEKKRTFVRHQPWAFLIVAMGKSNCH